MSGPGSKPEDFTADILSLDAARAAKPRPPPLAAPAQDFGADMDMLDQASAHAAVGTVIGAQDANPDHAGRANQLAGKLGVPPGVIEGDLPNFEKQHAITQSAAAIRANPKLASWLSADQQRARVAKDDFDQLGVLSKSWKAFSSGVLQADLGNQRGRLGVKAAVGMDVMPEVQQIERQLQGSPEVHGVYSALQKIGGFGGGLLDNFMHGVTEGGPLGTAAGAGIGSMAGGAGAAPGAVVGGAIGTGVGFKADMARVAAGNTYLDLSEMRGRNGQEIPVPAKEAAAIVVGLGTYALAGVGTSSVKTAGKESAAKLLQDAVVQATTRPTVARALTNFAGALGKAGLTGAALNGAMEGTSIFGEEFGKQLAGGQDFETIFNDPIQRQQTVDRLVTAAVDGAMLFPLAHLPFAAGSLVGDTLRARGAVRDVEAFQQVETGVTGSKTRARSLDAFQSFMAHETGGSAVENLGLTGEAVRTLYQSAGREPGPGDGLLGDIVPDIREQMQQASETGGDIIVPTAAYVAHLAGTPISESLRADIRFRPEGMTLREADAYHAARGEHLADLATQGQASLDAELAASQPGRAVYQDVFSKLRAAGQTVDAASQYAALVASRYETRAERLGGEKDALALYREQGLDIRREVPESLRHVATDSQDLVINALRNTDRKAPRDKDLFGPSLHEAIKAAGGIIDAGGELRGMDLDKAKTKGLIRKATGDAKDDISHSMDAMALRMWEHGYFPDKLERPTEQDLIDAMRGGDKVYSEGAGNERRAAFEEAVRDLGEFVGRTDIDVAKMSNEEIKARISEHIAKQDADGGRELMQVTPEQARALNVPVELPTAPEFVKAVYGTPGAEITPDGLLIDLVRYQKPEQEGAESVRTGVFYLPVSSKDIRHYRGKGTTGGSYGGQVRVRGETLLRRPLFVMGATGGKAPEAAFSTIKGKDALSEMSRDATQVISRGGNYMRPDPALKLELIDGFLQKYAPEDVGIAYELEQFSREGNRLRYALQEIAVAHAVREAGYDSVVGYSKGRGERGEFISEVFDVREVDYPTPGEQARLHPKFERALSQGDRGRITIDQGRSTITLFKDADLSTFLHETGHLWLEEMLADARLPEVPEALKSDVTKIMDHLGMKSLADEPTTEQHEAFARSMETYLMEGRAPSAALASAFRRFKSWLIRIYKSVASLNAPINDELRGVFDRMVASDTAIQGWRQAEGLLPLDKKSLGMTDAEYAGYAKQIEKALNAADDKMLRRTMDAIRRQRTAEWKAEAATVRADVEAQVRSRPDLGAVYFMRTGKLLDDPEAAPAEKVRISKAALEDMYGTEEAGKALPSGLVALEGGVHPDELADLFGYRSGDDMVRALMSLESSKRQAEAATGKDLDGQKYVKHLIDSETQERMLDRHGDALNDGSIEAEALAAVHNKSQADVMATEMRAIARRAGKTPLTLDDINAWADAQMADMPLERGMDEKAYARLEAKYGKEVQRALLKDDVVAAFEAKQKQVINHVMTRKAAEVSEAYQSAEKMMTRFAKTPRRETIQQSFMDQIHGVLDRLGMNVKRTEADAAATPPLREFTDRQAAEGQDIFVPGFMLDEGWRVSDMRKLTVGEFEGVTDTLKSLAHLGRAMREMEINGEKVKFSEIIDGMRDMVGDRTNGPVGYSHAVTKVEKAITATLVARAALRRMDGWALQMDRGDRNGPFTRYIVRPVYEALDRYRPEKSRRLDQLWQILAPMRKELAQGKIDAPEIGYTFANKGELLHAIGHTGNDSNMRKLLLGREWGEIGENGEMDTSRWDAMMNRLVSSGVVKKADYDTVQKIWDLLEELKPGAQDAHKEIYGVRFNEVTARPVVTPFGDYRGGYMPAITDRLMARDGQIREDKAALNEQQTGAMFPSTGRGFTKARVENYAEPLELNLSLIPSHIDSVLRFTHLQPTIRDVGRLMLKRSFRDMMRGVDPTVVQSMIVPWLQRTARQTQQTPAADMVGRLGDKAMNVLRRRSGLQILAFNITNTLQQVVGVAPAVLKSSPGAMMRSLFEYSKSPIETANRVAEASPFMDERMRSKSYDTLLTIRHALEDTTPFDDVKHWSETNGYMLQQMTQSIVDITTWNAAYEHAAAKGAEHADAVYAADAAVRETQGGYNPEDLSRFETGSALGRLFSHMYSYFGSQANLIGTEAALIKDLGFKKGAARSAMVYIFGLMIPALVGEAIYRTASGGWGDDDDTGEMEGLASFFFGAQAKYLAPMVPIAGPVAMAMVDKSQGDRIGTSPSVSVVKKAIRAPSEVAAALTGEKAPGAAVRDSMTALGLLTGLPLGQVGRPLGYAADVATGWQTPESAADVGRGLVTGRQKVE